MEFDGKIIHYNIHKAMELPFEEKYVLAMDLLKPVLQDVFDETSNANSESIILDSSLDFTPCTNMQEVLNSLEALYAQPFEHQGKLVLPLTFPSEKLLPSVVQARTVELKTLPDHLKICFPR